MKYFILIIFLVLFNGCNRYSYIGEYNGNYLVLNKYKGEIKYLDKYIENKIELPNWKSFDNSYLYQRMGLAPILLRDNESKESIKFIIRFYDNKLLYQLDIITNNPIYTIDKIYLMDGNTFILEEIIILNDTNWEHFYINPWERGRGKWRYIDNIDFEEDNFIASFFGSIPITIENFHEIKGWDLILK